MTNHTVDLDHNATTPVHPEVVQAMQEAYEARMGNAASSHGKGRAARRALEEAREGIGRLVGADLEGADPDQVILTSGGTEANNLALRGLAGPSPEQIIISTVEHPSVAGTAECLERSGWDVQRAPVDGYGVLDLTEFARLLSPRTRLVSIMLANNETGVLQPIEDIARLCHAAAVPLHTDAVQAVGKIPVHFRELGVSAMTLTAHKFHGPRGIGALVIRRSTPLNPLLYGGFQQQSLRPGTEPVELAIGFHHALQIWHRDGATRIARMTALRDEFEQRLIDARLGAIVNGHRSARLPHTSSVAFPGVDCQALHMALDLAGVACSIGSACASGSAEPSPVLLAMKLPPDIVESSLRFSLGALTTRDEIDQAVKRIITSVRRLQQGRHWRAP